MENKKMYLQEMENWEQIDVFAELGDYLDADENGQYFTNYEEYKWWRDLADAVDYIETSDVTVNPDYINELEDYITIANDILENQ